MCTVSEWLASGLQCMVEIDSTIVIKRDLDIYQKEKYIVSLKGVSRKQD